MISDLTSDELKDVVPRHSLRGTKTYLEKVEADLMPAITERERYFCTPRLLSNFEAEDFVAKVELLMGEMVGCPDGKHSVFHLCVEALILLWRIRPGALRDKPRGKVSAIRSILHADFDGLVKLVKQWRSAICTSNTEARCFIDFAAAKRHVYKTLPRKCRNCENKRPSGAASASMPVVNQSSSDESHDQAAVDPLAVWGLGDLGNFRDLHPVEIVLDCERLRHLKLLDRLQKWAYTEIRVGIMLTLRNKLPKELCLLILDHALDAEKIPRDPRVWEKDDFLMGMRIRGMLL
jgi:hypothetical protein